MEQSICGRLARALHIRPSYSRHHFYRRLCLFSVTRLGTSFAKLALDTQRLLSGRDSNVFWLDVLWHSPLLHDHLHSHNSQGTTSLCRGRNGSSGHWRSLRYSIGRRLYSKGSSSVHIWRFNVLILYRQPINELCHLLKSLLGLHLPGLSPRRWRAGPLLRIVRHSLSDAVLPEEQGVAGSFISTMV